MARKKKEIDPTAQMILTLQQGVNTEFWKVFKNLLEDEKKDCEMSIFDEEGLLTLEQREDFRRRRNVLQYIIELPELVIEKSKPKPIQKEPNFETYSDDRIE